MHLLLALLLHTAHAQEDSSAVTEQIEDTRASISQDERKQREALSHLFVINKKVKDIARRQEQLNKKMLEKEGDVRTLAQEVSSLETRSAEHKEMLNKRLRQLYQERKDKDIQWLFSAQSPVELERNHRFLRRMIDSDHKQLKIYISSLSELKAKKEELRVSVGHLASLQKEAHAQEKELTLQMSEKSKYLAELGKAKDSKLSELKGLREKNAKLGEDLSYAFFERKGLLKSPIEAPLMREYGTYVDPTYRFRLTHKGLFYSASQAQEVKAVFEGKVVFADRLPGYGKTVIVDHGDNYYSIYAFASRLKAREGHRVQEGEVLAMSGGGSPLFGPGLYFEIRHFTDAIDPRPWIKDSVLKTAGD